MQTIYKYPFGITDIQTVDLPINHKILHVGLDPQGTPCLWAIVDSEQTQTNPKVLFVVGTGHPMPTVPVSHLGSFAQGPFMWHIFVSY